MIHDERSPFDGLAGVDLDELLPNSTSNVEFADENAIHSINIYEELPEVTEEELINEKYNQGKSPQGILKKYWGYDSFREKQLDIIESALAGNDTLGLLPTGGGKSITFQIPGLILPGTTLVITPLIALMVDQVQALRKRHIRASAIHSGLPNYKINTLLSNAVFGKVKFLYISPERIASSSFLATLNHLKVSLIVVDECHCISQWGYDFRPSYLNIVALREHFPSVPILALTATATPIVRGDIIHELQLRNPQIVQKSFVRSNISYIVRPCHDKLAMAVRILNAVKGTAIIYCRNRTRTAEIATELQKHGFSADFYHAGLSHAEREIKQKCWMDGDTRIIVATNAFGMGIDKPDVRVVIHWTMPSSLEEYYQEAGRAGRDGQPSFAVALVEKHDAATLSRRIHEQFPPLTFVRSFYDLLMSYLQIGESDGLGKRVQFNFEQFVDTFHLHPIQSQSAMQILAMAGVFIYEEKGSRASRIMMRVNRETLYKYEAIKGNRERILEFILRRYSGVFTQFVFIEEEAIAAATGLTLDTIYETLLSLSTLGVLSYIPRSSLPLLTFTTRRESGRLLNITPAVYHNRKKRFEKRLTAVKNYLFATHPQCREQTLLAYFGETESNPCGRCDVCRAKTTTAHRYLGTMAQMESEVLNLAKSLLATQPKIPIKIFNQHLQQLASNRGGSLEQWQKAFRNVLGSSMLFRISNDCLTR